MAAHIGRRDFLKSSLALAGRLREDVGVPDVRVPEMHQKEAL